MGERVITGEWDGEIISRPKTAAERLIETLKHEHGDATRKGNFSKANVTKSKLELIGEDGDFECTREPQR